MAGERRVVNRRVANELVKAERTSRSRISVAGSRSDVITCEPAEDELVCGLKAGSQNRRGRERERKRRVREIQPLTRGDVDLLHDSIPDVSVRDTEAGQIPGLGLVSSHQSSVVRSDLEIVAGLRERSEFQPAVEEELAEGKRDRGGRELTNLRLREHLKRRRRLRGRRFR